MQRHQLYLLILFCVFMYDTIASVKGAERPIVKTTTGRVQGIVEQVLGKRIRTFLGIPFAEPPVGDLRFAKPVPIGKWKGIKQTVTPHNSCYQFQDFYDLIGQEFKISDEYDLTTKVSEDCLYLNVFTPENAKGLPTVIVIHGGGFLIGAANVKLHKKLTTPAFANMIVVTINYRLGPFGFMFLKNTESPGNQGLLDQTLALKWVHDNIEAFGGDKDMIAIEGVSAGGASVGYHLISPLSKGLFSSAMLQSGSPNEWKNTWCYEKPEDAFAVSKSVAKELGCVEDNGVVSMSCMKKAKASSLNALQYTVPKPSGMANRGMMPTLDGTFLVLPPDRAIEKANINVPIMVSVTKDEGSMFLMETALKFKPTEDEPKCNNASYVVTFNATYGSEYDKVIQKVIAHTYTQYPYGNAECIQALSDYFGDYYFLCPSTEFAARWSERGGHVYWYTFNLRPSGTPWPEWIGVAHGEDAGFILGSPLIDESSFTEYERSVSRAMMNYMHNFAKTGNPNEGGVSDVWWPEFTSTERRYLSIGDEIQVKEGGTRTEKCDFLSRAVPEIQSIIETKDCPTQDTLTSAKSKSVQTMTHQAATLKLLILSCSILLKLVLF